MKQATQQALKNFVDNHGPPLDYVARKLQYPVSELRDKGYFANEQIDAIALAISNIESGAGFVLGDQTGIGKGRVVAAVLRYAMLQGKNPVFVTEKANLYKDIYRDLTDIGMDGVRALMTNGNESIDLDDSGLRSLKTRNDHGKELERLLDENGPQLTDMGYDILFTTYSQMQALGTNPDTGQPIKAARHRFLQAVADDAVVVLDESHNGGGTAAAGRGGKAKERTGRAGFVRGLIDKAAGVMYSSATWAKRPDVMDLYFATDLSLAVPNLADLGSAIEAGGVPLQQTVSTMLAQIGQMIRRERSFAGIDYTPAEVSVSRADAAAISNAMLSVHAVDQVKESTVDKYAQALRGSGMAVQAKDRFKVTSSNFSSSMHNLVSQMLLVLKVDAAVDMALELAKDGKRPVITLANTMGSFMGEMAKSMGIKPGDPFPVHFRDVLLRYLDKSRTIRIKPPKGKGNPYTELIPVEAMDAPMRKAFLEAQEAINAMEFEGPMPVSPIDYMIGRLQQENLTVDEITGRTERIIYDSAGNGILGIRPNKVKKPAGRNKVIKDYQSGKTDVLILNQSGSTGLSLHADQRASNQAPRVMMIVQPELNIDTHMQMLGRINRTGQVVLPEYRQLIADVPSERRPAAVLLRKMASLNANTTAARGSDVTATDVLDFMNEVGDQVVAEILGENKDINDLLGNPVKFKEEFRGGGPIVEPGISSKATGRLPLLPVHQQEMVYEMIEAAYTDAIEQLDRMGQNPLEAKTVDLDAKIEADSERVIFSGSQASSSPFAADAKAAVYDVKRQGRPMTGNELQKAVDDALDGQDGKAMAQQQFRVAKEDFDLYAQNRIAKTKGKGDGEKKMLEALRSRFLNASKELWTGRTVLLSTEDGTIEGVVLDIVSKVPEDGNPIAPSAWRATFAVADSMRSITLPFSQIGTKVRINPSPINLETMKRHFDESRTSSREDRVIMTGNILAGYGKENFRRGSIVNFTMADGTTAQGVLMPKAFELGAAIDAMDIQFDAGAKAVRWMQDAGPTAILHSSDGLVQVRHDASGFEIRVPAAKAKGGVIFLNEQVLDALGGEFRKRGSSMRALAGRSTLPRVLDTMAAELGISFVAKTHKIEAREVMGIPLDSGSGTGRQALAPSDAAPETQGRPLHLERVGDQLLLTGDTYANKGRIKATGLFKWNGRYKAWVAEASAEADARAALSDLINEQPMAMRERSTGSAVQNVKDWVSEVRSGWKKSPKFNIYRTPDQLTGDLARSLEGQDTDSIKALWWSGEVYIFADNIANAIEAQKAVWHEVKGHMGLRELLGKDIFPVLRKAALSGPDSVRQIIMRREFDGGQIYDASNDQHVLRLGEEMLAYVAETGGNATLVEQAVRILRRGLARLGFKRLAGLTKADLRDLIAVSGMVVEQGLDVARAQALPLWVKQAIDSAGESITESPSPVFSRSAPRQSLLAKGITKALSTTGSALTWANTTADMVAGFGAVPRMLGMTDAAGRLKLGTAAADAFWDTVSNWKPPKNWTGGETMGKVLEYMRAGWLDRHGLTAEYIQTGRKRDTDHARMMMMLGDILKRIDATENTTKEQMAQLQRIIEGKEPTTEEWKNIAPGIRNALDGMGYELVQLGFLTEETWRKNLGKYLHVSYSKYENELRGLPAFVRNFVQGRQGKRIFGDEFKMAGAKVLATPDQLRRHAPKKWWGEKMVRGKPDQALVGTEWVVLENIYDVSAANQRIEGVAEGKPVRKRKDRVFWPADQAIPDAYAGYDNRGTFEIMGTRGSQLIMRRDWTDAEMADMGKIMDARFNLIRTFQIFADDIANGQFFRDIAMNPEWSIKPEHASPEDKIVDPASRWIAGKTGSIYVGVDWVRVPNTTIKGTGRDGKGGAKHYGDLGGRLVRPEIWRDLTEMDKASKPGTWNSIMTHWKLNKTARNPVVHLNNVMSNFLLMDLIDVTPRDFTDALIEYIEDGEMHRIAQMSGAYGGMFVQNELQRRTLKPIIDRIKADARKDSGDIDGRLMATTRIAETLWEAVKKVDNAAVSMYQIEDTVFRLATFMRHKDLGYSDAEAARISVDQFLNYDIRAPWVNGLRRTLLPFISYTYRAAPVVATAIAHRPWKLAKYLTLYMIWNHLAYELDGGDEELERSTMRSQVQGHTLLSIPFTDIGVDRMVKMPFRDKFDQPLYLDVMRWIPAGDVFDTSQSIHGFPAWMSVGGPAAIGFELFLNQQAFTRQQIFDPDLTDLDSNRAAQYRAQAKFLWQSYAPGAAIVPGTWHFQKIRRAAVLGGEDVLGRSYSVPSAVSSALGVKVQPHDPEVALGFQEMDIRGRIRKLQSAAGSIERQYQRNMLSESEYRAEMELIEQRAEEAGRRLEEIGRLAERL